MINSLVIAPTFLRSSCAVGQIERHLISNLSDCHYSHVLSSSNYDLNLAADNYCVHKVAESRLPHYVDLLSRRLGFYDLSYSPDPFYYSWNKRAFREAKRIITNNQIDYILTVNNPVSSHLLGLRLKKLFKLPWVAYMFDPWHNNPFRKYRLSYFKNRDIAHERSVAENADMLLFPNHELMESWIEIYGDVIKTKSFVLPFATSIPELSDKSDHDGQLVISHIGTLSENRRAKVFLKALSILKQDSPEKLQKVKFNIVGYITDLDRDIIVNEGLADVVTVVGHVSESECTKYYESSNMFLIVDIDCTPNLFYPSKLLKYFCYQKPIIGITTECSVVANELNKTGNHVFKYDDASGIAQFLQRVIDDPGIALTNDKNYYKQFLVENVARQYLELIDKMLCAK